MEKEKVQVKPRKDKKKNTQTGLLMGQNTNVFSQLSATYLQNKSSNTQEQNNFVKSTQIIQYHDPKINRLIALLRKKANVTKAKAAVELRQQFEKMTEENLEEFLPTFAQVFLEVVVNQQSKQVVDEFVLMVVVLFAKYKKIAIKQIGTLYAPLLVVSRPQNNSSLKVYNMLFNGTEQQLHEKALTLLLLKKQVFKKFILFSKNILQCQQLHKIGQQNYQKNCAALMKVLKDFIIGYEISIQNIKKNDQKKAIEFEANFNQLIIEINDMLGGKCIDEYLKVGGKAKASLLQMYQMIIKTAVRHPQWKIQWQKYAKYICQNYLDKDLIVQQGLWKYCNKSFIQSCLEIEKFNEKEPYSVFIKYLPKPDDKLLQALKIGGLGLYRELQNYCTVFPTTSFIQKQTHKTLIGKITFIRKMMGIILNELEDQNQARIQCYYNLSKYFIRSFREIKLEGDMDEKKIHELTQLFVKTQKQIIQNLQNKYYSNPPASRNSFTFYIPSFYCKLLEELHPALQFQFNEAHTFTLYKQIKIDDEYCQAIADKIFDKSKDNKKLLLEYLKNFPSKNIEQDLTQNVQQPQLCAKIFLLSKEAELQDNWFKQQWDQRVKLMVYDPRITQLDLNSYEQTAQSSLHQNIHFSPLVRTIPKIYNIQKHAQIRLKYFIDYLTDQSNQKAQIIPLLLSLVKDNLFESNKELIIEKLLEVFKESQKKLQKKTWMIGSSEIMRVRVICDIVIDGILAMINEGKYQLFENGKANNFIESLCSFALIMYNYKLEQSTEEILKKLNLLTFANIESLESSLLQSARKSIYQCYQTFRKSSKKTTIQEKQKRNRLDKCLQFMNKVIWYCMKKNKKTTELKFQEMFEDFLLEQEGWKEATHRPELWQILEILMQNISDEKYKKTLVDKIITENIENNKNNKFIAYVCCCQFLLALQRRPQTKRSFIQLQTQIFKNIENLPENKDKIKIFESIINQAIQDETLTVILGAKNLLKNLIKNYADFQPINLSKLLQLCLLKPVEQIKKRQVQDHIRLERNTFLVISLCSQLPLTEMLNVQIIYEQIYTICQTSQNLTYMAYTAILSVLWESKIGIQQLNQEKENQIIKKCINAIQTKEVTQQQNNFIKFCIFTFFNSLYNLKGYNAFKPFEKQMQIQLINPKINPETKLYGAVQLSRLKYLSKIIQNSHKQAQNQLMKQIPKEILTGMETYKSILDQMQNDEEQESTKRYENVIEMFIQSAEILIKFAENLSLQAFPDESAILKLMQCPFAGIKRTSFILLKRMYEMNLVERNPPKQFLQYLKIDGRICKVELDVAVANELSIFLNAWQAIIFRKNATERVLESQQYQLTLEDYLQQAIQNSSIHQLYYENFLRVIFQVLDFQLDYLANQKQYYEYLSPQELLSLDTMIVFEDELDLSHKIYRLTVKSLFMFILNFPLFLRDFIDRNKKYKNICDKILRNIISDAIFIEQITKIEMKQSQWKAEGKVDIFVTPKNKEIYAQYSHDTLRIGLRLVMKHNFPITPIAIEFGEGLRIQDGRWALMLQSQLHNRNNTIINGILLWKQNIDKKLDGAQDCAICYDIVNSSGQLPQKACKTCKKKFHSQCIMKWFNKSNKSECPLCKSQFL